MTHWNVPCPSAQERNSCSWLHYGEEQALADHLDTSTLAVIVLGSEITLSVLPVSTCILLGHGTTIHVIRKAADLKIPM